VVYSQLPIDAKRTAYVSALIHIQESYFEESADLTSTSSTACQSEFFELWRDVMFYPNGTSSLEVAFKSNVPEYIRSKVVQVVHEIYG
jgi:hypothetical protein